MDKRRKVEGSFDVVAEDLSGSLPEWKVEVAFDVGSNTGQTLRSLVRCYPGAFLHAFEPVSAAFEILQRRFGEVDRIFLNKAALGATTGNALMTAIATSTGNRIIHGSPSVDVEAVAVLTGDSYCAANGITEIQLLKIDTEGFDLEVLKGFESMLAGQFVDVVQVEASMNPFNRKHVSFFEIVHHLQVKGYHLFRVHEQVHESDGRPLLRRANPVFCSERLINSRRR